MRVFLVLLSIILAYGCANVVPPTGGPTDTAPPAVERLIPDNYTVQFDQDLIIIAFDEFIQIQDPSQILISPALAEPLDATVKRNTVMIDLAGIDLMPNTTYTIYFGDLIQDINEGNPLANFKYVFSTGTYIDSLMLNGIVTDAVTGAPATDILLLLYSDLSDSAIYKHRPLYVTQPNPQGGFQFTNLPEDTFRLYALGDANRNLIYDLPTEMIGFYEPQIFSSDTNQPPINLAVFLETSVGRIRSTRALPPGQVRLTTTTPISTAESFYTKEPDPVYEMISPERTTANYWFEPGTDSVTIFTASDTSIIKILWSGDTSQWFTPTLNVQDSAASISQPLSLSFPSPVATADTSAIYLLTDSVRQSISIPDSNFLKITMLEPAPESHYILEADSGAFTDIYGRKSLPVRFNWMTPPASVYGSLKAKFKVTDTIQYIVELIQGREAEVLQRFVISGLDSADRTINHLLPGSYNLRVIKDLNRNDTWDSGSFPQRRQPEAILLYPEPIVIRENWETEIEWNLRQQDTKSSRR